MAVIGGGVTGCSCALTLASSGVRVRLHEAREIAGGASGRNGGFALRGATVPYDRARAELGAGAARRLMALTERSLDRMEELAGDAFRRVGSLRLAADAAERDALRREHDALRDDGFAVEWVDELPRDARRGCTTARSCTRPTERSSPLAGCAGSRRMRQRPGRTCASTTPVTVDGVDADVVVVAGDGFTASLLPELAAVVRPTRGQVLVTEPLDELLYSRPHYARDGYDYWQQLPDGRLVLGGQRDASLATEETDVEETTPLIQERLEQLVAQLVGAHAAGHAPLGRDLGHDTRPDAARRPRPGPRQTRGSRAATPGMATRSGSPAATSSPARSSATGRRSLTCSIRRGSRPPGRRQSRPRARAAPGQGSRPPARVLPVRSRDPGSPGRSSRTPWSRRRRPTGGGACEHVADLRHVGLGDEPRFDGVRQLAAVARLLPVVAEEVSTLELGACNLCLAWAVGAHQRQMLPGAERACREQHLVAGRDRDDDVVRERLLERACYAAAELPRHLLGPRAVHVPDLDRTTARHERSCGSASVHTRADHRRGRASARASVSAAAPPPRRCAARSPSPRREPPAADPSPRSRRARHRSPSAGPAAGCPGTR